MQDLMEEWSERFHPVGQKIHGDLTRSISGLTWAYPEPALADEIPNPLFDSARDYFEQLEAYKAFQRKPTNHQEAED